MLKQKCIDNTQYIDTGNYKYNSTIVTILLELVPSAYNKQRRDISDMSKQQLTPERETIHSNTTIVE